MPSPISRNSSHHTTGKQINSVDPTAQPPPDQKRSHKRILTFVLKAVLGVALLSFVLSRLNLHQLVTLLTQERPVCFLAATALYVGGQMVAARRWQLLARMLGLIESYIQLLLYFFIGAFTNLFVPGLVGGDAARALYLGRRQNQMGRAIASVLADRLIGLVVLVWLAAACVAALGRGILPPGVSTPIFLLGISALAGFLLMPKLSNLKRLLPPRIAGLVVLLSPYIGDRLGLVPALLLSLLLHLIQVLAQYILGLGLSAPMPLRLYLLCVPATNVFASLPLTFNGLGIREGIYVALFGFAGVGKADAAALGLLWFAITTVAGLCASVAFILVPAPLAEQSAAQKAPDVASL